MPSRTGPVCPRCGGPIHPLPADHFSEREENLRHVGEHLPLRYDIPGLEVKVDGKPGKVSYIYPTRRGVR